MGEWRKYGAAPTRRCVPSAAPPPPQVFIVIDTQMMLGGKHQLTFSPDDYIFAA